MKIIDLLNKIAKGEINEDIKIEYQYGLSYEYCTIREFFDRYIVDKENLNQEITLEDTQKENKKIEKIDLPIPSLSPQIIFLSTKINEIIDRLNGEDNESIN